LGAANILSILGHLLLELGSCLMWLSSPSLRGAQRRRNPFVSLAAASPFTAPDQRQCLEQGP